MNRAPGLTRDEALRLLRDYSSRAPLHAIRLRVSRDGSRTDLHVLGIDGVGHIRPVTAAVAAALQDRVWLVGDTAWGIRESSGGVNPVTVLQDRLRRVLGLEVVVYES